MYDAISKEIIESWNDQQAPEKRYQIDRKFVEVTVRGSIGVELLRSLCLLIWENTLCQNVHLFLSMPSATLEVRWKLKTDLQALPDSLLRQSAPRKGAEICHTRSEADDAWQTITSALLF
jgi:hypothetical protein